MVYKGLVSIVMPSYNTASFIAEAIHSVLAQTYENWELLIVDDCSSDSTEEVISSFLSDPRIRYLKNEHNSGAAITRNRAIKEARGEWIAFLDSDDVWMPEKLERQLSFMADHGYRFSCTSCRVIGENSELLGRKYKSPRRITCCGLHMYNWLSCLTVMYHAPTVGVVQIADLKKRNDYALWLKVIRYCDCYYLDEVLAQYRVRRSSVSHDNLGKLLRAHYKMFRKSEGYGILSSLALTGINVICGILKKTIFVVNDMV